MCLGSVSHAALQDTKIAILSKKSKVALKNFYAVYHRLTLLLSILHKNVKREASRAFVRLLTAPILGERFSTQCQWIPCQSRKKN
ncbi:hypothetical protein IAD21_04038 [Abditibacteriota bacterium]|nr:hypothetical protein IAD21_04038 [Abditibacteriota bacterium]